LEEETKNHQEMRQRTWTF